MVAFDNNIYPFVPRSQECSLYHPSNGRQVWIRIIPFCLTCLSILYLHARRCTNARISFFISFFVFLDFAATATLLWLFSTFLLYTIYLMKDAVSMDGRCNLTQSWCSKVILKAQWVSMNCKAHAHYSVCSKWNKMCRSWISFRPSQQHLISALLCMCKRGFSPGPIG